MATVHGFEKYDIASDKTVTSQFKASAERIEAMGCQIIEGTGEEVPDSALDAEGRYNPNA